MQGASVSDAVLILKQGGVVAYPTETAYGLGADAENRSAVRAIFKIKGRASAKSVIVLMADMDMVEKYARVSQAERAVMRRYWPGPLTLALKAKRTACARLAPGAVAEDGTIAVRISSHSAARALVRRLGHPLVSTSANRAGGATPYSVAMVLKQLKNAFARTQVPLYIYNGGRLPRRAVSTIARMRKGHLDVLRQGAIRL